MELNSYRTKAHMEHELWVGQKWSRLETKFSFSNVVKEVVIVFNNLLALQAQKKCILFIKKNN